jgi:hypothetical protein
MCKCKNINYFLKIKDRKMSSVGYMIWKKYKNSELHILIEVKKDGLF